MELGEHEAFPVRDGCKHQLTFAASHYLSGFDIRGVSLSGDIICCSDDEVEPLRQWNVFTAPDHSTAMSYTQVCTFVRAPQPFPDLPAAQLPTTDQNVGCGFRICGKVIADACHYFDNVAGWTTDETNAIHLPDSSSKLQSSDKHLLTFNETVAAYFAYTDVSDKDEANPNIVYGWQLHVLRLKDQMLLNREPHPLHKPESPPRPRFRQYLTGLGPYPPPPRRTSTRCPTPDSNNESLILTRFHVLHFHRHKDRYFTTCCDVYDFYVNHLTTIELAEDVVHVEVSDDGRFIVVHQDGDRMVLFDVLKKKEIALSRKEGDSTNGLFFAVTEYAVDGEGKRTGDPGRVRVCFRDIGHL
ncbi:hypothetical protein HK097_000709 [Rhizophlyctis rosea]|uniref:Uncharacterized protein n=1 Tax=Rhizophlyctis rosea TaxID=64517 RepID=A0AAD5S5B4_9FUNG|nr:hypothetical protein HK097_000709 [Rhizophlyctis rosea]